MTTNPKAPNFRIRRNSARAPGTEESKSLGGPTEDGFGDAYSIWFGAFVPAKTPDNVVTKLSTTFFEVMAMPGIKDVIKNVGVIPHPTGPEEARKQMDSELENFGAIMKDLGIIQ